MWLPVDEEASDHRTLSLIGGPHRKWETMTELTDSSLSDYLQDLVLEAADVEEFLEELVQFSVQTLSEGSEVLCGITLLRRHKVGTVVSSSLAADC